MNELERLIVERDELKKGPPAPYTRWDAGDEARLCQRRAEINWFIRERDKLLAFAGSKLVTVKTGEPYSEQRDTLTGENVWANVERNYGGDLSAWLRIATAEMEKLGLITSDQAGQIDARRPVCTEMADYRKDLARRNQGIKVEFERILGKSKDRQAALDCYNVGGYGGNLDAWRRELQSQGLLGRF